MLYTPIIRYVEDLILKALVTYVQCFADFVNTTQAHRLLMAALTKTEKLLS